jgi:hypothetical protein
MIKPTANTQLAIIKKLERGNSSSELINELIHIPGYNNGTGKNSVINDDRLAMALKECFRYSTNLGRDIWGFRRKVFIKDVIETYHLFAEISEILERELP